ncbi:CLIP domain-containing serine protease B15-like, partial [Pollicipes pollicipes]|uniref:CLIP domain-containing serine protease B15-like n=1 Tax=Pollicipes pollicipes TaxID=41117 RepID=UPI001884CDAD
HVLTAAHCVAFLDNPDITPEEVRIGEVNFDTPTDCLASDPEICAAQPVNIKISLIIAHPEFQNIRPLAFPNDIAVLRLAEDVTFSDFRRPVCLPLDLARLRTGSDLTVGEEAIIVGWGGVDSDRMENFTPVLQGALVPVQSPEVCSGAFNISVAFENRICAGGGPNGSDTCSGDSGGPLLAAARSRFFQTGVSSFGAQFCGLSAAAYTRVADYIDWIQQAIATN